MNREMGVFISFLFLKKPVYGSQQSFDRKQNVHDDKDSSSALIYLQAVKTIKR